MMSFRLSILEKARILSRKDRDGKAKLFIGVIKKYGYNYFLLIFPALLINYPQFFLKLV